MTSFNNELYLLSAFLKTIGELSLQFQALLLFPMVPQNEWKSFSINIYPLSQNSAM